ncbi:isocitrate lyase/phosphoenolpyruvate mutase family protein [Aquincola sp. S2]|uniref:Isocitrate lyase/phosphoenolpyruvate mutase family protein n=1 Tax=Pseudaquabacterium terrae TaxID=2732868 RepID=A0ABX2EM88_9BURK|nr:isocitrate lyase/phosphoenolpyruvate mutase family protein [Aquabacterium terrae]NRF69704.1 isocitrate lyase/phosphoenolpyruvate mutase family protein [Aquabacterium terrae]
MPRLDVTAADLAARARAFRALHRAEAVFLMPNAWNAGSARLLEAGGFAALATTSAGIAYSLGRSDGSGAVSRSEMMDNIRRITHAVSVPVNADLEAGYGPTAADVAETIRLAIDAGAAGGNIEDATGDAAAPLFDAGTAAERIAAARAAADASGLDFTLTARSDAFLCGHPDAFDEAVQRCRLYAQAGADCLFVPGVRDSGVLAALVREVAAPMNVVMGLTGASLSVQELGAMGVRRISIGGSLARATFGLVRRAADEMRERGTFSFAEQQIPDAQLGRFFAEYDDE